MNKKQQNAREINEGLFKADLEYNKFNNLWQLLFQERVPDRDSKNINEKILLNNISSLGDLMYKVVDKRHYKVLFLSENIFKQFGIDREVKLFDDMLKTFLLLPPEYMNLPSAISQWRLEMNHKITLEDKANGLSYAYCGIPVKNNKGETKRLLINVIALERNEDGDPLAFLIAMQDITYMLKSKHIWVRLSYGKEFVKETYFHSKQSKRIDFSPMY